MAGFLETLFGPDGIGGQPGVPMRALYATPIAGDVAKTLTDFGKNPELFFGGSARGGLDLPALLSSDYRKQKAADMEADREANKALATARGVLTAKNLADFFGGLATDTAQGETRKTLIAQGMDPALVNPLAAAAKSERHSARRGGKAAGLLPEVANIADVNSAQQAGQSQFTDRLAREQNVQQADLTRGNQTHQFGLSKRLADYKHGLRPKGADEASSGVQLWNALTPEQRSRLPENVRVFGEQGAAGNAAASAAFMKEYGEIPQPTMTERRDTKVLKGLKRGLRKGLVPEDIRPLARNAVRTGNAQDARDISKKVLSLKTAKPVGDDYLPSAQTYMASPQFKQLDADQQALVSNAVAAGDKATLKVIMPPLLKNDFMGAAKIFSSPTFTKLRKSYGDLGAAKEKATLALESAADPANPGFIDESLFGPVRSMIPVEVQLRDPTQSDAWKAKKQAHYTYAIDSLSTFILSRSGQAASDKERAVYTGAWLNGNEASGNIMVAKYNAIQRAMDREQEIREQEARLYAGAMSGGVESGLDAMFDTTMTEAYADNARQLAADLVAVQSDPELQPKGDLSPEERAKLEKYSGGR